MKKIISIILSVILFVLCGTGCMYALPHSSSTMDMQNLITNGDFEGTDFSNFVVNDYVDGEITYLTQPRVIVDPTDKTNHCIVVSSNPNPGNSWETQFFITVDEDLKPGGSLRLSMRMRADEEQTLGLQYHGKPTYYHGSYAWIESSPIQVTTKWTTYTQEWVINKTMSPDSAAMRSLAFDLSILADGNNCYFDDIVLEYEYAPQNVDWVNLLTNGDAEKPWANPDTRWDDTDNNYKICAWGKTKGRNMTADGNGWNAFPADIEEEKDANGNHVFVVHAAKADTPNDENGNDVSSWDNQFWIQSPHAWSAGTQVRIKFRYKASKNVVTNTQIHLQNPSAFLFWQAIGDVAFTTDWQEFDDILTITDDMDGGWSIAFNLNANEKAATNFYFDDLSWSVKSSDILPEPYAVLTDNNEVVKDTETGNTLSGKTLTFYYDDQKIERGGLDVKPFTLGWFDDVWTVNSGWSNQCKALTSVIFDESFANCTTLTSTDYWFFGCSNLATIQGIKNLKTDNVTSMDCMFYNCSSLTNLDVSGFKTDNVTDTYAMFHNCYGLKSLDLSSFNMSKVEYGNQMFAGCSSLKTIYANDWNMPAIIDGSYMFYGCMALVGGAGTTYDADHHDYTYAHVDGGISNPGYFTEKNACQAPTIKRDGTSNRIIMTTATAGANIFYTTDGSEPTEESSLYTGPVTMTFSCTVRAIAVHEELAPSEISEFTVDWLSVYGVMVNYNNGVLALACATPNSQIRYEIGGKEVTESSTLYTGPITLTDNRVVKYKAYASGLDAVGGSFTPRDFTCAGVILAGYDGLNFELSTTEADATIYYTTDGTVPTKSSEVYLGKTPLTGLCTITAVAVKPYKNDSEVLTQPITYFFDGMTVYLSEAGHVEDAMKWRGIDGMEKLTIECKDKGALNATDMAFVRTMKDLKHLNMTNARFNNNTVPEGAFSGMNIVSVEMPAKNITTMGNVFRGCDHLAAIVWDAQVLMASSASSVGITNDNLLLFVKNKVYAPQGVKNVVVDGKAGDIVLSDDGSFYCPQAFTAQTISYTHKYSQTTGINECRGWETIALPFDVQTFRHERLGTITPFTASNASARQFWLCSLSDEGFVWANTIKANTPYIISMPNNEAYATPYILSGNIIFEAANVTIPATNLKTSRRGTHVFTPCFDAQEASATVYVLNKNDENVANYKEGSVFLPSYRTVKPFEAYMSIPTNAVAPRYIPIRDEGDTGISPLQTSPKGEDTVYDLSGRKIVNGKLSRGVYIIDGKKIMVK